MPRTFSPAMAAACLAQQTAEVLLACLTISGDGLPTFRICSDSVPLETTDGTFQPYPFEIDLPEDVERSPGQVELRICNVDREVTRLLKEYEGIPQARLEIRLASQPDTVEMGPFDFTVLSAEANELTISLKLGHEEDLLNQQVPAQSYNPSNSPGLWI